MTTTTTPAPAEPSTLPHGVAGSRSLFDRQIMGQALIFKAFALIIIGGLGNIGGVVAAAVGLGLMESWVGGFFQIVWQEAAVFIVMIGVLLLRPDGLFKRGALRVG